MASPAVRAWETSNLISYGPNVILDSGASHHMHHTLSDLTNVEPILSQVMLPDGSVIDSDESGLLRLLLHCVKTGKPIVVPLLDCMYVPGLTVTLWSVSAFVRSGHHVYFEPETIRVILHGSNGQNTTVFVNHVFDHSLGEVLPVANYMRRRAFAAPTRAIVHRETPIERRKRVSLELIHNRLGHVGIKSILASDEAHVWNDVNVTADSTDFCVDCKLSVIRKADRGDGEVFDEYTPGGALFLENDSQSCS